MTHRERYAVIAVFLLAVSFGVISNLRQNAATERTRVVVCGVVQEAAVTESERLANYAKEPPTTSAGAAQRTAAGEALQRWTTRAAKLGCNE